MQVTGLPPVHTPAWHVSVWVHALPSLHVVASGLFGLLHLPLAESHVPATWHWSLAAQTTGLAPTQLPDLQVSSCVHALPSSQRVASVTGAYAHAPVCGLHDAVWHGLAGQFTAAPPVQTPT